MSTVASTTATADQTTTQQSQRTIKAIVVPYLPQLDKILNYLLVRKMLPDGMETVLLYSTKKQPSELDYQNWNSRSSDGVAMLLDVGLDNRYHGVAGSSSEVWRGVIEQFGGTVSPIDQRLIELINQNNTDGSLKNTAPSTNNPSIAKLLRDFYALGQSGDLEHINNVVNHSIDVIKSYYLESNKREWSKLSDPEFSGLKQIWDRFSIPRQTEPQDFTLGKYFKNLFMAGFSPAEIMEKVGWWIERAKRVKTRRAEAEQKRYGINRFSLTNKAFIEPVPAGIVQVNDTFEFQAVTKLFLSTGKFGLLVIRNSRTRQVTIMASKHPDWQGKLDLGNLCTRLLRIEPELWYCEKRLGGMLMNGSAQYIHTPPTALTDSDLSNIVRNEIASAQTN